MPSSSPTSPPGYAVAIAAIRQRPLHFYPAAGFNVFDSGTLYPTLQLISEPDTGHALPALPSTLIPTAHTRACSISFSFSFPSYIHKVLPRPPPVSSSPASSTLSRGPCFFLSCSLASSVVAFTRGSFSARGTRPPPSRRGTGPALRLFQTHFNSLPGSAAVEWRSVQVRRT